MKVNAASGNSGYLYSCLANDPDLREIVDLFVEEMPDRVGMLLSMLQAGDWKGLQQVAHQLKGAAGSYGFDPISPMAGKVESAILDGEPEQQISQAVEELIDMCNRTRSGTPAP